MEANGSPGPEKEELEKQKLQAEITEINVKVEEAKKRLDFERKDASKEHIRSWAAIIISFVAIATGAITIGEKAYTFLSQNAQTQKIKINQDMINLVDQLRSPDEAKRDNAAMLLSAYEMEAVPVLLRNLQSSSDPEPLIASLKEIKKKLGDKNKDFQTALIKKATDAFKDNLNALPTANEKTTTKQRKAEKCIANFISTLKVLYGDNPKIEAVFQDWKKKIESREPAVEEANKNGLRLRLEGRE
jgi:hypothetical protein